MRRKLGLILALFICILHTGDVDYIQGETNQGGTVVADNNIWLPLVFRAPFVNESIYYVDVNKGSDDNPGTISKPWQSIQKAADTMLPGDKLIVIAGDYSGQRVSITHSGKSSHPITYLAQGRVVMKGFDIVSSYINIIGFEIANTDYQRWNYHVSAGIFVEGSNNIIEGNYIHDSSLVGIELDSEEANDTSTQNNIVRNNKLFQNEMVGIDVNGRNNLIEGNEIWRTVQCHPNLTRIENIASDNNGKKCPYYPAVAGLDADGMRFFGQGHIFRKNIIHDIILGEKINGVNVNVNPHIDCFQTWSDQDHGSTQNVIFEQNYCENLNDGMYVFTLEGNVNHLYIRNNIFKAFGGINANGNGRADYLYIYNNVWANERRSFSYGVAILLGSGIHASIKNNIFYNQSFDTVTIVGDTSNIEIDYNLAYNNDGKKPHCVQWGNGATCQPGPNHELWNMNPQFVNPEYRDYHLRSTSPAIDSGYNLSNVVTNDFDNVTRPLGLGYDIGAYEYFKR